MTPITRWCNGNTAPFGGVIHGSSPCRVAPALRAHWFYVTLCKEAWPARPSTASGPGRTVRGGIIIVHVIDGLGKGTVSSRNVPSLFCSLPGAVLLLLLGCHVQEILEAYGHARLSRAHRGMEGLPPGVDLFLELGR